MTENNNQYNKIILDAYNRSKEIAREKEYEPNNITKKVILDLKKRKNLSKKFDYFDDLMESLNV